MQVIRGGVVVLGGEGAGLVVGVVDDVVWGAADGVCLLGSSNGLEIFVRSNFQSTSNRWWPVY